MIDDDDGPVIGSLFSGYGGLDEAVRAVLGGRVAWHAEKERGPSRVLAARYPTVPNLGDVTRVGLSYSDEEWEELKAKAAADPDAPMPSPDWSAVEPIEVLTGGFPCQDLSLAGRREGLHPTTRSGLWTHMAYAIDQLRPALVVIENVRGLLSARAASDVEPNPWGLGDESAVPLRALGAVLGQLADLGYDASWQGLRASDVGAPHERFRVFVLAWPAGDPSDLVRQWGGVRPRAGGQGAAGVADRRPRLGTTPPLADGSGLQGHGGVHRAPGEGEAPPLDPSADDGARHADADADSDGRASLGRVAAEGPDPDGRGRADAARDEAEPSTPPPDPRGIGRQRRPEVRGAGGHPTLGVEAGDHPRLGAAPRGRDAVPDTSGERRGEGVPAPARVEGGPDPSVCDVSGEPAPPDPVGRGGDGGTVLEERGQVGGAAAGGDRPSGDRRRPTEWGPYGGAIRRWEAVLGREAPPPTSRGRNGERLDARFVEWMMGLPDGWVTAVPELSRAEQIKALGNGVVPQQAAMAIHLLLPDAAGALV